MSADGSADRRKQAPHTPTITGNGNGVVSPNFGISLSNRLRINPNKDHKPEKYDDLQVEFSPLLFSSLEKYLPPNMLGVSRDLKLQYMRDILLRYLPEGERIRVRMIQIIACVLLFFGLFAVFFFGYLTNMGKER